MRAPRACEGAPGQQLDAAQRQLSSDGDGRAYAEQGSCVTSLAELNVKCIVSLHGGTLAMWTAMQETCAPAAY